MRLMTWDIRFNMNDLSIKTLIMDTGIKEQVLEEIVQLAQKHGVKKVILFGSRARGDYHRVSDIDLAVYGGNIAEFALDVEEDTSTLLMYDVVDMGKKHQKNFEKAIETEGKIILNYSRDSI